MVKKVRREALRLTQQILEEYWGGNPELLLERIHKDIVWIGSAEQEYIRGAEKMRERVWLIGQKKPMVYLDQQVFEEVSHDARSCVVSGRYRIFTDPSSGQVFSGKQRVTFVWVWDGKELRIIHLHLSDTLQIQKEDEQFPVNVGTETYQYLQRLLAQRNEAEVISLKDNRNVTHLVRHSEILYIMADRNYTIFGCMDKRGDIRVRQPISAAAARLPEHFFAISRSCIINLNYVTRLEDNFLMTVDGSEFSVPEKKCFEVKKLLLRFGKKVNA